MGSRQSSKSKANMSGEGASYQFHSQEFEFLRHFLGLQLSKHRHIGVSAKSRAVASPKLVKRVLLDTRLEVIGTFILDKILVICIIYRQIPVIPKNYK